MVYEEEEKTGDLLSLSWEEISECNEDHHDGGAVLSLSFFGGAAELQSSPKSRSVDHHHWDVVSCDHDDDGVKSLSNHSIDWTYRDALVLSKSKKESPTNFDRTHQLPTTEGVLIKKKTKFDIKLTLKKTIPPRQSSSSHGELQRDVLEELNEHLLDMEDKPMSEKQRRKYERSRRRRLLRGHTGRANPQELTRQAVEVETKIPDDDSQQPGITEDHATAAESEVSGKYTLSYLMSSTWNMNNKNRAWDRLVYQAEALHPN